MALISQLKFDEASGLTAYDSVGSYNGALQNMVGDEWNPVNRRLDDSCLELKGTDDRVRIVGTPVIGSEISYSIWFKTTTIDSNARILLNRNSWGAPPNHLQFYIANEDLIVTLDGLWGTTVVASGVCDGKWHLITFTYKDSRTPKTKVFFDGTAGPTHDGSWTKPGGDIWIGIRGDMLSNPLNHLIGFVDDFRIYDHAMELAEHQALYDEPSIRILGPGEDYTTLPQVVTYITSLLSAGMYYDITIKVRSGEYGDNTVLNYMGNPAHQIAGHTIRFTTHENDLDDPATLKGTWRIAAGGTPGFLKFDHLKLRAEYGFFWFFDSWDSHTISTEDCVIYWKNTAGLTNLSIIENGGDPNPYPYIKNTHVFVTCPGGINQFRIPSTEFSRGHNNLICVYQTTDVGFVCTIATSYNNTLYNYGSGGCTITGGNDSGTILNQDPNLVSQVIQSASDSPDTMAARDEKLTALSLSILDNAYAPEATSTDINGISRPQYAGYDRGAYEIMNFPPLINLDVIIQRSDAKVKISYNGVDPDSEICSLTQDGSDPAYQYAIEPLYDTWVDMTPAAEDPEHDGVSGLLFIPSPGTPFNFIWDAVADLGYPFDKRIKIRLGAWDGSGFGGFTVSLDFRVMTGIEFTLNMGDAVRDNVKAVDWTDPEQDQIRDSLGVDGDKTTAVGGQLQVIKSVAEETNTYLETGGSIYDELFRVGGVADESNAYLESGGSIYDELFRVGGVADESNAYLEAGGAIYDELFALRGPKSYDMSDLGDKIDLVQASVEGISNVTRLTVSLPTFMARPVTGTNYYRVEVALKNNNGQMEDPDGDQLALNVYNSFGTSRNDRLFKDSGGAAQLDPGAGTFTGFRKLERIGIGLYLFFFQVDSAHDEETLTFKFGWEENSLALYEYRPSQIGDPTSEVAYEVWTYAGPEGRKITNLEVGAKADVYAEVKSYMETELHIEAAVGQPPSSASVQTMLNYLYYEIVANISKLSRADGEEKVYQNVHEEVDPDDQDIKYERNVFDSGGVTTRGKARAAN